MQIPSLPFKILALGPFGGEADAAWSREPIPVHKAELDQVMSRLAPTLHIPLPRELSPAGGLDVTCTTFKGLHPDGLIQATPFLASLRESSVQSLRARPEGEPRRTTQPPPGGDLDRILEMVALADAAPPDAGSVPGGTATGGALQDILAAIYAHEPFKAFEAAWRGLKLLLGQGGANGGMEMHIVPTGAETLEDTLDALTPGLILSPPSLILIDLPFDSSQRSLDLLERVAALGDTCLAPALCWVSPAFFHLEGWDALDKLPYLPHHLEGQSFAKWRRLKSNPSARWLVAACNRFLARTPYGPENPCRLANFRERGLLWAAPVWALACLMGKSFGLTGWAGRFTSWRDVRVEDLPLNTAQSGRQVPTEMLLSEERVDQFIRAGMIPLVSARDRDFVFTPRETTVADTSLGYQAFLSRVTQFVLWCKDHFLPDIAPATLAPALKQALGLFWEQTGHPPPTHLEVTARQREGDDGIDVLIALKPAREIVPSGEEARLEFVW